MEGDLNFFLTKKQAQNAENGAELQGITCFFFQPDLLAS